MPDVCKKRGGAANSSRNRALLVFLKQRYCCAASSSEATLLLHHLQQSNKGVRMSVERLRREKEARSSRRRCCRRLSSLIGMGFSSMRVAFNITKLLERFLKFGNFNNLLTKNVSSTGINRWKTITILSVCNDELRDLMRKQREGPKGILSNHVVLDYYDTLKLQKLKNKSVLEGRIEEKRQSYLSQNARFPSFICFWENGKSSSMMSEVDDFLTVFKLGFDWVDPSGNT
ncbi:unnamed protein product [Fraxinus pennsylvanica]|uniref:Uncharacterized protein n=1 Tax=Fraxinus pennsylvanica TaxID=56036 RepID=A0AAD2E858_9LAMI|nr:unnamed protein product [Fraxinus pennsylvanica]